MKRLIMIQHCGSVGGSGLGLLTTAEFLKDYYDIVIYCETNPDGMFKRYEREGFCVKPLPVPLPTYGYYNGGPGLLTRSCLMPFKTYKSAVPFWKKIILEEKADILLVNSMVLAWMYHCIEGTDCRIICHVREVLRSCKTKCGTMILDDLEHFDAVWFISEHEKDKMNLQHPMCTVVRDCLTQKSDFILNNYCKSAGIKQKFRILYVGGVSILKGFPTLVKACKYFDEKVEVYILGYLNPTKPQKSLGNYIYFNRFISYYQLKKQVEMLEKNPNVYLLGHVADLNKWYSFCDVLVFPSRKAHQARPAFEAGFFAKPVIISDFIDTRDNISDGINGITFKPNSPKSLAKAVNMLAGNREKCKDMGINNRKHVEQTHTYEVVEKCVVNFMKDFDFNR